MASSLDEHRAAKIATTDRLRAAIKRLFSALRDESIPLDLRAAIELLLAAFAGKKENT